MASKNILITKTNMKNLILLICTFVITTRCTSPDQKSSIVFSVTFTEALSEQAQDGRLLLMLAKGNKTEPRFQINDGLTTQ